MLKEDYSSCPFLEIEKTVETMKIEILSVFLTI